MPPIPGNQDTIWMYPTVETTEDKRATRLAVMQPKSYEIIGADGLTEGGLRVFPGFKSVHVFDGPIAWIEALGEDPGFPPHNNTSKIIDVFPINFTVGDDGYGYGFVYRVRRRHTGAPGSISANADIFIDYYETKSATANRWHRNSVIASNVSATKQMSVSVFGRHIYVFVEDSDVLTFTTDDTGATPTWDITQPVVAGPGEQPDLIDPEFPATPPAVNTPIGLLDDASRGSKPGVARIFLTNISPIDGGFALWDQVFKRDGSIAPGSNLVPTSPFVYPGVWEEIESAKRESGDYSFAYVLFNSKNGRRSALSRIATAVPSSFPTIGGGSTFPVWFLMELVYDHTKYDQCYIYRSVRVQSAGGTYIAGILHLERIITLADYVDKVNPSPNTTDTKHVTYWYTLSDIHLVYQDVFMDKNLFDEKMPKGGVSLMYEGTMLVGNIASQQDSSATSNRTNDSFTGLGEFRWSSLVDLSPELFPPGNSYVPSIRSNEIIAARQVGPNCIAFSRDRQYHIRKEANYIKVQEMHEGFGVVNSKALDTVGSMVYFVTTKGVKAVDTQGSLDDVRSLNGLILGDWATTLDKVSVAFDPTLSALFIHNEKKRHTACFWFTTASVTELYDTTFSQVVRGVWPQNFTLTNDSNLQYANPLLETSFWVKNNFDPFDAYGSTTEQPVDGTQARWELMTVDYTRENANLTLMPLQGTDCVLTVPYTGVSGSFAVTLPTNPSTAPTVVNGRYAYILKSQNRQNIGKKVLLKARGPDFNNIQGATSSYAVFDGSDFLSSVAVGDVIGFSPVYFRWVGGPIMPQAEDGTLIGSQDWFRVKHVKTITAHFTGVSDGPETIPYADSCRYRSLVYRGNDLEPTTAETVDQNDQLVRSILDDTPIWSAGFGTNLFTSSGKYGIDGATLAPGVEIFFPNLDYMMCGVMVSGSMRSTFRSGPVP